MAIMQEGSRLVEGLGLQAHVTDDPDDLLLGEGHAGYS
jgi:hypothetical protein